MKQIRSYLLVSTFIFSFTATAQELKSYKLQKQPFKEFTITGKIEGRDTGRIILGYRNSNGKYIIDTTTLKNGKFSFKGNINQPTLAGIVGNITSNLMDDPNRTIIFLEPTKLNIQLKENRFQDIRMTGSTTQNDFSNLQKSYSSLLIPFYSVDSAHTKIVRQLDLYPDSVELEQKKDSLWKERMKITDAISATERQFLTTNKTSHLTPFLLQRYVGSNGISIDSATRIFEKLSPTVRQSDLGFAIKQLIYSKKLANVGDVAANFEAIDINGKTISLKEFRGKKFVLLDFWYAGCPPCRAQSPVLKLIYSELKDNGLEIIGMADESDKRWRTAIAEDGTSAWRHLMLSSVTKTDNNFPIDLSYNLIGFPTLVLIDKEGIIVHKSNFFGGDNGLNVIRDLLSK